MKNPIEIVITEDLYAFSPDGIIEDPPTNYTAGVKTVHLDKGHSTFRDNTPASR